MKKLINITGQQMIDMGWSISNDSPKTKFILEIDTTIEIRKIRIMIDNDGGGWLNDYSFDYAETLYDLHRYNHLSCGIVSGPIFYNDEEKETSEEIHVGNIAEIIGDTTWDELMVYPSLDELNKELSGFSFTDEPEYE